MSIQIKNISVKNLGPLGDFSTSFKTFNVIYSHNEKGKTFLCEFLIRSLFRNKSRWDNIREVGKGKVAVTGIGEEAKEFKPSSESKLDDYLTEERGLSNDLVKLLVAKGAQTEIAEVEGGVDKHILKQILSEKQLLDQIDDNIKETIKKASLVDGSFTDLDNRGEGGDLRKYREKISRFDEIEEEIAQNYSLGELERLRIEKKKQEQKLTQLEAAKRHEAFKLDKQIREIEGQLEVISQDLLTTLDKQIQQFEENKEKLQRRERELKEAEKQAEYYQWLKKVEEQYQSLIDQQTVTPPYYILGIAGLLFLVGLSGLVFFPDWVLFLIFLAGIGIAGVYFYQLWSFTTNIGDNRALKRLKTDFEKHTGKELDSIATIQAEAELYQEAPGERKALEKQIDEGKEEIEALKSKIHRNFYKLTEGEVSQSEWPSTLQEYREKHKKLSNKREELNKRLHKLGVKESDYLEEKVSYEYSRSEENKVNERIEEIKKDIDNKEDELDKIKQRICGLIDEDPSMEFENVYQQFHEFRNEIEAELGQVKSKIVAGIFVHDVVEGLREEEDEKIMEGLSSDFINKPLKQLTNSRYEELSMQNGSIIASTDVDDYKLENLSTGAREQIMLALRIGFAQYLLRDEKMFLLLDDAFQHVDWTRREVLVQHLAELVKEGWQVVYFTMDDHIRDLFVDIGKKECKNQFKKITL